MIEETITAGLWPAGLLLIVPRTAQLETVTRVKELLRHPADWRATLNTRPITVASFDERGCLAQVDQCGEDEFIVSQTEFSRIISQGLKHLFHRRDGMIRSEPASHFIYPSGKHGKSFMRIANLLILGPEVSFIALATLPYLPVDVDYLLLDTSSIMSIALSAMALRLQIVGTAHQPIIGSFSSWSAVRSAADFPNQSNLIVLISASTSGNMAREIVAKKGVSAERVVTLFSLADNKSGTRIVCDLTDSGDGPPEWEVEKTAEYASAEECELCRQDSKTINFVGDQFLADAINCFPIDINKSDRPAHLSDQMEAYRGKGAFYLRNRGMGSPTVDQFFVDIPKLLKVDRFSNRMNNAFSRHVPASTGIIVSPDDVDSQAVAAQTQAWIKSHTNKDIPCLTSKDLPDGVKLKSGESVIIAIGAIETGTQIQAIDRALRDPCGPCPRLYIVGVSKHQNLPAVQHVIKDLQFSGTSNAHGVVLLEQMTLPSQKESLAWIEEWAFLSEFVDPLKYPHTDIPGELLEEFRSRMKMVEGLPQEDLRGFFWNSSSGSELRLRDTFAFWDFPSGKAVQADVIVTIGSILQSLREGPNSKLRQSAFHHSVISPSMFSRYNDGIIQASLLRCALPREIDYSGSDHLSQRMGSLLRELFKETDSETGEAVPEFLVALAMGRLKLKRQDAGCALDTLASSKQSLNQLRDLCVRRITNDA